MSPGVPCYELRARVHGPDDWTLEVWQLPAPATPHLTAPLRLAGLRGRNLALIQPRLLRPLARLKIEVNRLARDAEQPFPLPEEWALRLALLKHIFLRAVSAPPFSRANDISRDDVIEMVFTLRIDEALAQLRRAFPISFPSIDDFSVSEPSDYPDEGATGYATIHRDFIDPIARAQALALRIATAIANEFGAHG